MSTTVQVLLEAAYSRSTANDPGKLATDAELIGRLNRIYQDLFGLAARQRPDEFIETRSWTVQNGAPPFVTIGPGIVDIRSIRSATGAKVHLIPETETERTWHVAPSVYRVGLTLYSRNQGGDPTTADVLTARVIGAPAVLTALGDALDTRFPDRHVEVFIGDLALYLDAKDDGRDAVQFSKLASDQAKRLASFAAEYDLDASALEYVHAPAARMRCP